QKEIARLEQDAAADDFWSDNQRAQGALKTLSEHRSWVEKYAELEKSLSDLQLYAELAAEQGDESAQHELEKEHRQLVSAFETLEFRTMLSGPDDARNAIMTLHPGAGGTESADWAGMLFRMYMRWFERRGWKAEVMDFEPAEEAGVRTAAIEVTGEYAYGFSRAEIGIHRLVRISPFDAGARRHTSFVSVFVYPEVEEVPDIVIRPEDIRMATFRASGAGGQYVNKTDSAVRLTHNPTGIVVTCQTERSQLRNRESAMKMLMAKLYQKRLDEERARIDKMEETKSDIAWGHQIRSYVFHPYQMVKDHRTDVETSNVQAVMDGELDEFVRAYLLLGSKRKDSKDSS
ncbi:MAG: peptide chain release factor 2, partial [bacterium]